MCLRGGAVFSQVTKINTPLLKSQAPRLEDTLNFSIFLHTFPLAPDAMSNYVSTVISS